MEMLDRREQVLQETREAWAARVGETKSGKACGHLHGAPLKGFAGHPFTDLQLSRYLSASWRVCLSGAKLEPGRPGGLS